MTRPAFRPVGEVIADIDKVDPALGAEVRAALSAKRSRDDLADAEAGLREFARTGRDGIARWLQVLLVEYDRREGRVVVAPTPVRRTAPAPAPSPAPPVVGERSDVVVP